MTVTLKGNAPVDPNMLQRIMLGEVAGWSYVHKFGAIDNASTTLVPVATAGVYPTPTSATALEIVSSNANDTSAGTGARSITVFGLDANWEEQTETVNMNGTTAVDLANTYTRVYRLFVASSGTYASSTGGSHAGTITLREDGGGAAWAQIGTVGGFSVGQSQIAAYTIPAGKRAWVVSRHVTVETTKSALYVFFQRPNADTVSAPYSAMRAIEVDRGVVSSDGREYNPPVGPYVGPCDIGFMGAATSGTADITIDFEILLQDV